MVADRGTREAPVYSPVLGEIVFSVRMNTYKNISVENVNSQSS